MSGRAKGRARSIARPVEDARRPGEQARQEQASLGDQATPASPGGQPRGPAPRGRGVAIYHGNGRKRMQPSLGRGSMLAGGHGQDGVQPAWGGAGATVSVSNIHRQEQAESAWGGARPRVLSTGHGGAPLRRLLAGRNEERPGLPFQGTSTVGAGWGAPVSEIGALHLGENRAVGDTNSAGVDSAARPTVDEPQVAVRPSIGDPQAEVEPVQTERNRRSRWDVAEYETPNYRPERITDSRGSAGIKLQLMANYFRVKTVTDWVLCQYHVDFQPPMESKRLKMGLLAAHASILGDVRVFDGSILFMPRRLPEEVMELYTLRTHDNTQVKITIRLTCELQPGSPQTVHLSNLILRKCLMMCGMKQVGRHFFNLNDLINIPEHNVSLAPGFQTSIFRYEDSVLLEADIAHKVLRTESVWDEMSCVIHGRHDWQREANMRFIGATVLTRYSNTTYRIDDIDWDARPTDSFQKRDGTTISFKDYFRRSYEYEIMVDEQPLLVSRPRRRQGQTDIIMLVPELCLMTGVNDQMRSDFMVMKALGSKTRVEPRARIDRLRDFTRELNRNPQVAQELGKWQLQIETDPVEISARQLPQEEVLVGRNQKLSYRQSEASWVSDMRNKHLLLPKALMDWVLIFPRTMQAEANTLQNTLMNVAKPLGMNINTSTMVPLNSDRITGYAEALQVSVRESTQLVVCLLSSCSQKNTYDMVKKFTCITRPVPSQVVVKQSLKKNTMSVCTKIAMQINCKIGGALWTIKMPAQLGNFIFVGIDVYHDTSQRNRSVAGVVASMNKDLSRFYSHVTFQPSKQEIHNNLPEAIIKSVGAFFGQNGVLPGGIIIHRDGVGDGMLQTVYRVELGNVLAAIGRLYESRGTARPKVVFTVVKKRINSRFILRTEWDDYQNPPPGTLVDTVVTRPEWYDYFLISQSVRQGTVGPTHYNVIWDTTTIPPNHMQMITYKLTHQYFNWQGTISVPATCQYAHKLAYLVGTSLHRSFDESLADKLFFL